MAGSLPVKAATGWGLSGLGDLIHQYQPGQSWSGQRLLATPNLR